MSRNDVMLVGRVAGSCGSLRSFSLVVPETFPDVALEVDSAMPSKSEASKLDDPPSAPPASLELSGRGSEELEFSRVNAGSSADALRVWGLWSPPSSASLPLAELTESSFSSPVLADVGSRSMETSVLAVEPEEVLSMPCLPSAALTFASSTCSSLSSTELLGALTSRPLTTTRTVTLDPHTMAVSFFLLGTAAALVVLDGLATGAPLPPSAASAMVESLPPTATGGPLPPPPLSLPTDFLPWNLPHIRLLSFLFSPAVLL
mmetsp:Transcript_38884/g.82950  ORF Transcript_38884/g.82950 Transcript_38884/m.82950 type:complete len:261 (+) Transcript_38884:625-1407(+)